MAHGQALKRLQKHKKTLVQYVNDWLLLGKRVHKYNPKYPEWCPSCTSQVEDRSHLMTCPATSQAKWRTECISNIRKEIDKHNTAHPIKELLLEGLNTVLNNQSANNIQVNPEVADVAAAQAAIGWNQILKGRFSKLWVMTQDRHMGQQTNSRVNGLMWTTRVKELILVEWLKMWMLQNEDRHGCDIESRQNAETRQTIHELEQFYEAHDGKVTARLQWLFADALEIR